jgi:hypothetical protein
VSPVELTDGSGRGAKSYDREIAWPSIYQSVLSALKYQRGRDREREKEMKERDITTRVRGIGEEPMIRPRESLAI